MGLYSEMYLHIQLDYRRQCRKVWAQLCMRLNQPIRLQCATQGWVLRSRCTWWDEEHRDNNLRYGASIEGDWTIASLVTCRFPKSFFDLGILPVIPGEQSSFTGWRASMRWHQKWSGSADRSGQEYSWQPIKSPVPVYGTIAMHKGTLGKVSIREF